MAEFLHDVYAFGKILLGQVKRVIRLFNLVPRTWEQDCLLSSDQYPVLLSSDKEPSPLAVMNRG